VDQSSRRFFVQRGRGCSWSTIFPIFDLWIRFRRYWRSKSKVVRNRAKFWTVFCPPKFQGAGHPKILYHVITTGSRHVWIKICDDIPISPEVIDVYTLNFKPNFTFSRLKFFGTPSQLGCALGSLGQSLARVKILGHSTLYGPKYSLQKNIHLAGSICTSITFSFVDQSSRSFFVERGRGCNWSTTFPIFDLWIRLGDIRDQSRKLSEIAKNFGRFLPSQILGGRPSKNCTHVITPSGLRHVVRKKRLWGYSH